MKTIRISDSAHEKLTQLLGDLIAQTKTLQTYTDAIENLLTNHIILPAELLAEVENFIREAIRFLLKWESEEYKYIEIPKQKYDKLNQAIKDMNMPYHNAAEFIEDQIDKALQKIREIP